MPSLRKAALAICIPLFVGQQGRHHAVRQIGRQQMTSHVLVLCHVSSRYVNRGSSSQGRQYQGTGCMTVLSVSSVPRYWMPDNIHVQVQRTKRRYQRQQYQCTMRLLALVLSVPWYRVTNAAGRTAPRCRPVSYTHLTLPTT